MGGRSRNVMVVGLMLSVFLISLGSPLVDNTSQDLVFADESVSNVTPTGQSNIVSIGSYPDGVNDAISINVPSGEAVTSIDLSLDENVLPVTAAKVWDSSQQITITPQAVYDGIDVNGILVLQLLPQGWAVSTWKEPTHGPLVVPRPGILGKIRSSTLGSTTTCGSKWR